MLFRSAASPSSPSPSTLRRPMLLWNSPNSTTSVPSESFTVHSFVPSSTTAEAAVASAQAQQDAAEVRYNQELGGPNAAEVAGAEAQLELAQANLAELADGPTDEEIAAADAGKHIFCEKPFTITVEEAERTTSAVQRSGVKHMIGFNYRRVPYRFPNSEEG